MIKNHIQGRTQDFILGLGGRISTKKGLMERIFLVSPPKKMVVCPLEGRKKRGNWEKEKYEANKIYKEETSHFTSKRCPRSGESEETNEALEEKCC